MIFNQSCMFNFVNVRSGIPNLVIDKVLSDCAERSARHTWAEATGFIYLIDNKSLHIARNPVSLVLMLYSEFIIESAFAGKYLNKLI